MKKLFFATVLALLASSGFVMANDDAPPADSPQATQPAQPPAAPPAAADQAAAGQGDCQATCITKTVTTNKIVGYQEKVVKVPIYKKVTKIVKVAATPVETDAVKVAEPEPQIVKVKRKIIVVEEPEVIHAPTRQVTVMQAPSPRFVQRPPVVIAARPPATVVSRPVCCPPGVVIPGVPPCPPGVMSPTAGYSASSAPAIGKMTGLAGNCPAGTPVGAPYQCPTSSTGWCICK